MTDTTTHPAPRCYSYIRFSTSEQLKGDSLSRQTKAAEEYAKKRGLNIDTTLSLRDLGVSAYSGANRQRGALSVFLKCVEKGKVPEGSILIVESLDRLSRESVSTAFGQFTSIIDSGITIVTLFDGMEYKKGSLDMHEMLTSLISMSRAHEESRTKAKRLASAWGEKRNRIAEKKLTARCPAWLTLDKEQNKFEIVDNRDKTIERIFALCLGGTGTYATTRILNQEGVPTWGRGKGWHQSYVSKILHAKAVTGEFQPHLKRDGKKIPAGDPVPDYFPRIIDDETFFQAQEKLKKNTHYSGKTGNIRNLFGRISKCGYCGGTFSFINKGKPPKSGQYIVCDNARRGHGCNYTSMRYPEVEESFLEFCKELTIEDILESDEERKKQVQSIRADLGATAGKITELIKKEENYETAIASAELPSAINRLVSLLEQTIEEKEKLDAQLTEIEARLTAKTSEDTDKRKHLDSIKSYYEISHKASEDERIEIRRRLREEIREIVKHIFFFPNGLGDRDFVLTAKGMMIQKHPALAELEGLEALGYDPDIYESKEAYASAMENIKGVIKQHIEENSSRDQRFYAIIFYNGTERIITYNKHSKRYEQYSEKTRKGFQIEGLSHEFSDLPKSDGRGFEELLTDI
ncbi:site-specific recombinase [Desulfoluna limicola]|uniref:Site-specific recombinase n=1 Tax=Desulfoluna limicola TaxID=2810562 RepID=A0ABM7PJW7_9BACT|nr:recombinase family protein [Desulfoluna limicola]BCS97850.1 site-specific recombinase [Desulfoluna limicola]